MTGTCKCGKPRYAKGMCEACYGVAYRQRHHSTAQRYAKSWRASHPQKQAEYYRTFYITNRAKVQALNKAWIKAHPDWAKAAKHNRRYKQRGSWTAAEWSAMKKHYGNRCLACGRTVKQLRALGRVLVPDHVLPISKGGKNVITNLQPLCHGIDGCNNHKANKHVDYRRSYHGYTSSGTSD
jgi:hypothetical protein